MKAQTVTVLIPTHNRAELLLETLESILNQTRRPDEVIIINDGSTDDTVARLEPYQDEVQILTQKNSGKSVALNNALSVARGDLIWVFDDDDIAEPDALETLIRLLEDDAEADFAYGRHDRFEILPCGRTKWQDTGYWQNCPQEDFLFESLLDMFAHQPGMLVRKSLYDRAGRFDEKLVRSQDYDMLVRLARYGRPAKTGRILFHQRQHNAPRGTVAQTIKYENRQQAWKRYDQVIALKAYNALPLERFLPRGCALSAPGMLRRALIRRGVVMVRKNLWQHAHDDLKRAAGLSDSPLTPGEIADLRKAFMQKYDADTAQLEQAVRMWLPEVKQTSPIGAQICRVAARALIWRIRDTFQRGRFVESVRLALLAASLGLSFGFVPTEDMSSPARR